MSITERIRAGVERALADKMKRVSRALEEQMPLLDNTAPSLEELERILADLQRQNAPRGRAFLKSVP